MILWEFCTDLEWPSSDGRFGRRVECAPDRNAKRRTVVCEDRHPCARATDIACALDAGRVGHPLPDTTPPSGLPAPTSAEVVGGGLMPWDQNPIAG